MTLGPLQTLCVLASLLAFAVCTVAAPAPQSSPVSPGYGLAATNSTNSFGYVPVRQVTPAAGIGGLIIVLSGFSYCFMGKKAYGPSVFLCGFFTTGIISFILLDVCQQRWRRFGPSAEWIYLIVITPLSLIGGLIFRRSNQLAVCVMGALHGFVWSVMILFTGLGQSFTQSTHIVFILAFVCVGVTSVFFMEHMALVVGTAFGGAFFVVVGADLFACTGLAEAVNLCMDGSSLPGSGQVPGIAWGLLAAFVVLGIAGWYVQTRSSAPMANNEWNPAYWLFGAIPPSARPPIWFPQPTAKAEEVNGPVLGFPYEKYLNWSRR